MPDRRTLVIAAVMIALVLVVVAAMAYTDKWISLKVAEQIFVKIGKAYIG